MRSRPDGPRRTCVGCRRARPKGDLVRLVRRADGVVVPDPTGAGRGAYVCASPSCLERALKPGRLRQAFRKPCAAGPALVAALRDGGGAWAPAVTNPRVVILDHRR